MTTNWNFWNLRWRRPPSWKSLFWPLLINRLSDFSEILYEEAKRHADKGYLTKMQMCKIQDGGRPPLWKSLIAISVKNCPISIKFGTLQQMVYPIAVTWPKIEIFKIQDGGGRHLENRFCGHNSSTIFRFRRNFVWRSRMASRQRPHDKNCKLLKSKMADGRHLKTVKSPYLSENIIGFWQNLVYYSIYWTWWGFQKCYHSIIYVII